MKLLAAALWLALLPGSQASPLSKKPTPRLEQVTKAIVEYEDQVLRAAVALIQTSELGKEIDQWRLYSKTEKLFHELSKKLPPQALEQLWKLNQEANRLLTGIWDQLGMLQEKALPYEMQLKAALDSYTEGPLELVEPYGKQLASLAPSRTELQEKLGSYAQELGLQELERGLAAYARALHQTLSPYAEDVHGWLSSRWDALMQWFQ